RDRSCSGGRRARVHTRWHAGHGSGGGAHQPTTGGSTRATAELHAELLGQFKGDLLRPGDDEYANARGIWNGMVARRPGLIARCTGIPDVQAVVRGAAAARVLTAVRCGGHSLAGFGSCDDGLVIDLSCMRDVSVDPQSG